MARSGPSCSGRHAVDGDQIDGQPAEADAGVGQHGAEPVRLGGARVHRGLGHACRDRLQRSLRLELPVRDDHGVVDGLGHLGQQVRRHQDGAPLAGQVAHEVAQPGDALGVESVGGLVEDQDVGVADQRAGQFQPLPHAHGEPADLAPGVGGQPDQVQHHVGPGFVVAPGPGHHAQMGAGSPGRVEAGRLQDRPDRAGRVGQVPVELPADGGAPGIRGDQPEQHPQGGRLARAVGPEEAGDPSRLDHEVQMVDGQHRPEVLGQPRDLDGQPAGGRRGGHRVDDSPRLLHFPGGTVTGAAGPER